MVSIRFRTHNRMVVLAPSGTRVPGIFRNIEVDTCRHEYLLTEMQRFRGTVYSCDDAIRPADLTADGRHKLAVDEQSWHVLSLDRDGRVCACLRYLDETHASGFDDLCIRNATLSREPELSNRLRRAVDRELQSAQRAGMGFGEVGGWAVAEEHRLTFEPLRIILATYGLLRLLGGALGVATATSRHDSAPILRRIGLTSLVEGGEDLPPYFDPRYGCHMEVLEFDSRHPAPKYEHWVNDLAQALTLAPVIRSERRRTMLQRMLARFEPPCPARGSAELMDLSPIGLITDFGVLSTRPECL